MKLLLLVLLSPAFAHGSDVDDDGWPDDHDCDTGDPTVYPGAEEVCDDGVDNDCDGLVDADDEVCDSGCGAGGAALVLAPLLLAGPLRRRP